MKANFQTWTFCFSPQPKPGKAGTARFCVGLLTFHALWLFLAAVLRVRVLPGPLTVYGKLWENPALAIMLLRHSAASLGRVAGGMALSVGFGLPLGLLMAFSRSWGRILTPLVYFSYPIPKTALLPAAMLLMGLGEGSKLLIMTLTTVFQVMVAARDGVSSIDPALYQVAVSAGLSKSRMLGHITLPALLPALFTALRVGTGTSLAILLIVEAYGTRSGLGYFILDAWSRISYPEMYAGITALAVLGAVLFLGLELLCERLCPWLSNP